MASFRLNNTLNTKLGMFTLMMSYITKGHEKNQYLYKPMFCTKIPAYKAFLKVSVRRFSSSSMICSGQTIAI